MSEQLVGVDSAGTAGRRNEGRKNRRRTTIPTKANIYEANTNGSERYYLVTFRVWSNRGVSERHTLYNTEIRYRTNEYGIFYDYDKRWLSNRKSETIPTTMAESNKSDGNDGFYLVITSRVVAVGIVALYGDEIF